MPWLLMMTYIELKFLDLKSVSFLFFNQAEEDLRIQYKPSEGVEKFPPQMYETGHTSETTAKMLPFVFA